MRGCRISAATVCYKERLFVMTCVRRARGQEGEPRTLSSPAPLAFALAKLPPDMNRVIVEFLLGAFQR